MMTTREMIRKFNEAFDRPVNQTLTALTVEERELLGKLLFEEVVEYCTKGLGLKIVDVDGDMMEPIVDRTYNGLLLVLDEGQQVDPIECADGLGDVNVVAHFAAHWQGFNLDRVTEVINESNMSKLGEDGKPIINGVTPDSTGGGPIMDPSKPIGKILKGPNFKEPHDAIREVLNEGNY